MNGKIITALSIALVAIASVAAADPPRDPAMAETLFKTGKDLLQSGDWPGACAKFEASYDLDPAVGTLVKIARCRDHDGKLAAAWYDYQRALKLNQEKGDQTEQRRKDLDKFIRAELATLEPRVPKLRVVIAAPPAGLRLTRNAQELPLGALGEALPIDPGAQRIIAEAPGYRREEREVAASEGQLVEVEIRLEATPPPPLSTAVLPPVLPPAVPPPIAPLAPESPDAPAAPGRGQRIGGIVVGSAGVILLGVAAGFGVSTLKKVGASADLCGSDNFCDPDGITLRDQARASQTVGLVLLGAGVAAVGGGIAIYLTAPKAAPSSSAIRVLLQPSGMLATGSF